MEKVVFISNKLTASYHKIGFPLLCVAVFLLKIPPFLFLFQNAFFNTHSIARYIIILLFFLFLNALYRSKIKLKVPRPLTVLILAYFLTQSLSVVSAVNITAFLTVYKDILFSILLFFMALTLIRSSKDLLFLALVLLAAVAVDIFIQYLIYFQPDIFFSVISPFLYSKFSNVLEINYQRQRFFVDFFDTALMPLAVYSLYLAKKPYKKILYAIIIAAVSFFALVSNFRTQLVMAFFSVSSSLSFFIRRLQVSLLAISALIIAVLTGSILSASYVGYNTLDRIINPGQEEIVTVKSRFEMWQEAAKMGAASPLFGVGLGNYYDNLTNKDIFSLSIIDWRNELSKVTLLHPHNVFFGVFAESGFLGLASFTALIGYFLKKDLHIVKKKVTIKSMYIVSFWSLFLYSLLNPPTSFQYQSLFWILRAAVESNPKI